MLHTNKNMFQVSCLAKLLAPRNERQTKEKVQTSEEVKILFYD
jgi:hypothetical protein